MKAGLNYCGKSIGPADMGISQCLADFPSWTWVDERKNSRDTPSTLSFCYCLGNRTALTSEILPILPPRSSKRFNLQRESNKNCCLKVLVKTLSADGRGYFQNEINDTFRMRRGENNSHSQLIKPTFLS